MAKEVKNCTLIELADGAAKVIVPSDGMKEFDFPGKRGVRDADNFIVKNKLHVNVEHTKRAAYIHGPRFSRRPPMDVSIETKT